MTVAEEEIGSNRLPMLPRDAEPAAGPAELVPLAGGAADLHDDGPHPVHHRQHSRHAQEVTLPQCQCSV